MLNLDAAMAIVEYILFASCVFILVGSVFISIKMRFVQLRLLPKLFRMLKASISDKDTEESNNTILPHKALLTAMSTTIGISTIVGPVIAIHLGGPGALLGFLLTAFFGSAATYTEVNLSMQHRKRLEDGTIMGGPMQYLKNLLSPGVAKWYAVCCLILMTAWSAAQANQMAAILDSPLFGDYRIPTMITGAIIAVMVIATLLGGIRRIGALSAKLVPLMFVVYLGSSMWILVSNVDKFGDVFMQIFQSAFNPYAMINGTLVGGVVSAMRWGMFKGIQCSEAGIGTQTIPHSMAETKDPEAQATMAMLSTYTAGCIAFFSGFVALITNTWQDSNLPLGITMVAASFQLYYQSFGVVIVAITTILFGFGTVLGNAYNGSQCFNYLTQNKKTNYYLFAMVIMIIVGSVAEVKTLWSLIDIVLACMALPHMAALMLHAYRQPSLFAKPEPVAVQSPEPQTVEL